MSSLFELSASEAAELIRRKEASSRDLVGACLERISAREQTIHAWTFVDYEGALAAASRADSSPGDGLLHGVPIGLKDIIDTAHLPTTYGSAAFANHQPPQNAECVNRLLEQGAVIIGKTVTTEFAFFAPGPTVNPHNPQHTPGGSSSGSAAAVADFHVPITLGTQTAGSIIRPASFNGVYGYKPSYQMYSTSGVHPLAPSLDTLGPFARSVDDLALTNAVLGNDFDYVIEPVKPERIAVVRTPYWQQATESMRDSFERYRKLIEDDGIETIDFDVPEIGEIAEVQMQLMALEAMKVLDPIDETHGDSLRPETRRLIEQGRDVNSGIDERVSTATSLALKMINAMLEDCDVILTPSALGEAPQGIDATGDPIFNRPWTFCRAPCVNLPIARGEENLPLGAQLVGARDADRALLRLAKYLAGLSTYRISTPM